MTHHSIRTHTKETGFTLIEVMIAMGIFTILVTIGIGAVLDTIRQHHSSQNARAVMDSLNFVMDDMASTVRLSQNVRCLASGETFPVFTTPTDPVIPESCPNLTGAHNEIVLNDQSGNHVMYAISVPTPSDPASHIYKLRGEDPSKAQLVSPPEVSMDYSHSGFFVHGAEAGDGSQPTVTIRLAGTISYQGVNSKFAIETTVTLRSLDS